MNLSNLDEVMVGEQEYRLKQARELVLKSLIENWGEAIGLPLQLREKLNKECPLDIKGEIIQSESGKDALKAVITLDDGLKIESVLMKHGQDSADAEKRNTVCVSSQVGCTMGCAFCATGSMGFKRSLTKWEIIEQVIFFARLLKKENQRVSNVVFMGMGEPFLNYDNVIAAIRILNDKGSLNIGARKISISTCGVIEGIRNLAQENLQVNLAISLHAPEDELRSKLMPINIKYPLKEVLKEVDEYIRKTSRQVMFEYLLLKGINDSEEDAEKLAKLMKKPLYFVNLIVYNPTGKRGLEPSPSNNVKLFKNVLEKSGVEFSERYRFGRDIKAACGQLASKNSF
ncbi:MAG: 23S rRNA (adenine(2503)-C(2))-methyltransferase RlmN [Candidatus Pacebacteria bacterium]|nr:23S rRNA (adenine(2503)-C(2))-methyltransferase RlmN [Candidatus Paceibacterota bacterium]